MEGTYPDQKQEYHLELPYCGSISPLHYVAPPATNYENEPARLRYIIFPTPDSSRVIKLSCPIRPGALEESYSVEWQTSTGDGLTTLENSAHYDFPVNISPSQPVYRCRVSIQHRNDQEDTIPYNGPEIMIEKKGEVVVLKIMLEYKEMSSLQHYNNRTLSFIAVLATIDSDIQNVNITKGENANFTCNFSEGDVDSTVKWRVGGHEYDCGTAEEEDIEADSNGCYTTETQSVLLIRDTSSFTPGRTYTVQCILQQNIPQEFRDDESFKEEFNELEILTRTASLTITSTGGESVTLRQHNQKGYIKTIQNHNYTCYII